MLSSKVILGSSKIEGVGIFAREEILPNEVIYEFDPEQLLKISIEDLSQWPEKEKQKFVRYAFQGGMDFYYGKDIEEILNDHSFFMNHSCDPNCWNTGDDKIVARRKIPTGEELTIDYATIMAPNSLDTPFECNCNSSECRKLITKGDCLRPEIQKKYEGHFLSFIYTNFIKH